MLTKFESKSNRVKGTCLVFSCPSTSSRHSNLLKIVLEWVLTVFWFWCRPGVPSHSASARGFAAQW